MAKSIKRLLLIPDEIVINKILVLRGKKVMVDKDSLNSTEYQQSV